MCGLITVLVSSHYQQMCVCVCVCLCLKSVCSFFTKTKKNILQRSSSKSAICDSLLRTNPAQTFLIFNMLFSNRKTTNTLLLLPNSAFYRFCESPVWKTHEFAFHNTLSQENCIILCTTLLSTVCSLSLPLWSEI